MYSVIKAKQKEERHTYTRLAMFHILNLRIGPRNLTPFIHQAVSQIKADLASTSCSVCGGLVYVDTREPGHPL